MDKVLIYPFIEGAHYIVDFSNELCGLEIVDLVSLRGWNEEGKKYYFHEKELIVKLNFEEVLRNSECSIVWFTDVDVSLDFEVFYYPQIKMAMENNKMLIMGKNVERQIQKYMTIPKEQLYNKYFRTDSINMEINESLLSINTPVVYVCSVYEGLDKFRIQMKLRKELIKRRISVFQVGSKEESKYFGFLAMPDFMFDYSLSDRDKVLGFNKFLREYEKREKPDIIVVGVPGEMYAISKNCVENFGLLAMKIFYSCTPDILILSVPYSNCNKEYFRKLSDSIYNRFGTPVDFFVLSNKKLILNESELTQKAKYLVVEGNSCIKEEYVYKLNDDYEIEKIVDNIIAKLQEYGQVKSI